MKLTGEYEIHAARDRVWEALLDPEILANTLPGCEELTPAGPDEYEMKMKLSMATVAGAFKGKVRIEDKNPPESYRLTINGNGKIGFIKGTGKYSLSDAGESLTKVNYEGDMQVGGMIAGVAQRLMDMTAKMMIKRFFTALDNELAN